MTADEHDAQHWIDDAKGNLDSVRHAIEDFQSAPDASRARTAVRNFLNNGRSVTWTLEHLVNHFPTKQDFRIWWDGVMAGIRQEESAQFFYKLRNPVVKEGQPVNIHTRSQFSGEFVYPRPNEPTPEGAHFILDGHLDAWWQMPDGSRVPARPIGAVQRFMTLGGMPETLRDRPLVDLMYGYLTALEEVIRKAEAHFADG